MSLLVGLVTCVMFLWPAAPRPLPGVRLECPATTPAQEVCVFTNDTQIVAINPTDAAVKVVIQIQRIENVELTYRYPFVEVLPPRSSRVLITYRISKAESPFALDYDWGWALTR